MMKLDTLRRSIVFLILGLLFGGGAAGASLGLTEPAPRARHEALGISFRDFIIK